MERGLRERLKRQIASGRTVLFTGAGFSLAAENRDGRPIPSVDVLKSALWRVAYPSGTEQDSSSLGDLYAAAVRRAQGAVGRMLKAELAVAPDALSPIYGLWFSVPWHRIYTLNLDDLEDAANVHFNLQRPIHSLSALRDGVYRGPDLESVHLNGRARDFPDVTFSAQQYGLRTAAPDVWYQQLAIDVAGHPVVFVGTELDEPPLWQQLALRGMRQRGSAERRPPSYLVTPSLSRARQEMLEQFNVDWIPMRQEDFAQEVLADADESIQRGHELLASLAQREERQNTLRDVGALIDEPEGDDFDLAEFLLGRQPVWKDITHGYAIERAFEHPLMERIRGEKPRIVVVTGTAGAGTSTTLMRVAVRLHGEGYRVGHLSSDADLAPWDVRLLARRERWDYLVLDDADRWGAGTLAMLEGTVTDSADVTVLVGMRATSFERLELFESLEGVPRLLQVVPYLEDSDIELLLDALGNANRLGSLRGKSRDRQRHVLANLCNRLLLVALIEATSNERFDHKVERECSEMQGRLALLYSIVVLASSYRYHVSTDQLLLASGETEPSAVTDLERLRRQGFVLFDGARYLARHRVIAERALAYFRRHRQLAPAVEGLIFALATRVGPASKRRGPERGFLTTLLNHDWMSRYLRGSEVRSIYDRVEQLLRDDYHYWLQRGSYEVERGDLRLARNFLEQAYGMAADDPLVQTEWAYMNIKDASADPSAAGAAERVELALNQLEAAIDARGASDSYPFHVYGSQGLAWLHRARLSEPARLRLLDRLRSVVGQGVRQHPRVRELERLAADLQREYLMTAVSHAESPREDE